MDAGLSGYAIADLAAAVFLILMGRWIARDTKRFDALRRELE